MLASVDLTKNEIHALAQTGIYLDADHQTVDPSKDAGLLHLPLKRISVDAGLSLVKLKTLRCLDQGKDNCVSLAQTSKAGP